MVLPPENLSASLGGQADQALLKQKNRSKESIYEYSNEFTQLLNKLYSDDAALAIKYRDGAYDKEEGIQKPELTKFAKVRKIWSVVFPGRKLTIEKDGLKAWSDLEQDQGQAYPAKNLSDGELVAFYIIARILEAARGIVIIDEPEIHLHSLLARRLWDILEEQREDIRFIYITHDLPFAQSRRNAAYIGVKPGEKFDVIPSGDEIPPPLFMHILGAASSNIYENKTLFCEGEEGGKDELLYRGYYIDHKVAVIPVGGCDLVKACVRTINKTGLISNHTAYGIVDRDDRCDDEIEYLNGLGLTVLNFSEIEALICKKEIFVAIAQHLAKDNPEELYSNFIEKAANQMQQQTNIRVLERCKQRATWELNAAFGDIKCDQATKTVRQNFEERCNSLPERIAPGDLFAKELEMLKNCIESKSTEILKYFPGKAFWKLVKEILGIEGETYFELIHKSLTSADEGSAMSDLKAKLRT